MNEKRIDFDKRIGLPDGITLDKDKATTELCDHYWKSVEIQHNGTTFVCSKCGTED